MCALAMGIDLGTTNSCGAVYRNKKVEIIPNEEGTYTTPSCVSFTDDGILAGHEAVNESHKYISNTIFEAKRLINQPYNDRNVQKDLKRLPYTIFNDDDMVKIRVKFQEKTKEYSPEEISSFVLKKLRDQANYYLKQDIRTVVVTVPAYFNDLQRQATVNAATIAGFKTVNIINEPTAAAIAFNYQNPKPHHRNILVYDFGGGTFDVSIVAISQGKCKVKATKGDLHLGGMDIDSNLVNFIKDDFQTQYGVEIGEDDREMRRLKNGCEKIKKRLSGAIRCVQIELNNLSGKDYLSKISREQFEELNKRIFKRTLTIVKECLHNAGLTEEDIDDIVLVGGSSRIPKVQAMLAEFFGEHKINKGVNPDEAVAYGAAIHAMHLVGDKSEVEDVISLSLGIAKLGCINSVIIPCNTPIPAKITQCYYTVADYQQSAEIIVNQGENKMVKDNFELGRFTLTGLRRALAESVKIDVCFEINSQGILQVTASEIDAVNAKTVKIDVNKSGLTREQIEQKIAEAEEHSRNELKRKKFLLEKDRLEETFYNKIAITASNLSNSDKEAVIETSAPQY